MLVLKCVFQLVLKIVFFTKENINKIACKIRIISIIFINYIRPFIYFFIIKHIHFYLFLISFFHNFTNYFTSYIFFDQIPYQQYNINNNNIFIYLLLFHNMKIMFSFLKNNSFAYCFIVVKKTNKYFIKKKYFFQFKNNNQFSF